MTNTAPVTDMKAGVGGIKAPLSQLPKASLVYASRAFQYGATKYKPGNYLRPPGSGNDTERLLDYISAAQRHLAAWATEIMRSIGTGRAALELKQACYAADDESGLPHVSHALASLLMGVQQAVDAGLLPDDPGVTWGKKDK